MVDIDQELNRLDSSENVHESDRDAIHDFMDRLRAKDRAEGTLVQYAIRLRVFSERSDVAIVDMQLADAQAVLDDMANGTHPDVKDDGIQADPYRNALCAFTNFTGQEWVYEEFDVAVPSGRDLEPDDLLYTDDVDALLDACGMDARYKALIAWGLATGQRLDALRTIRIKHVTFTGPTGDIRLNQEEGNLKGAKGSIPMFWAKHWLRDWLEIHPHRDNPEAAVFCPDSRINTRGDAGPEPLKPRTIQNRIKKIASDAGLEKNVYPHLFRHCAGTRFVLDGLSEPKIKSIMGWTEGGGQFETYVHLADELRNDSLREDLGLPTSGEETPIPGIPTLEPCACGEKYPPSYANCPTCGLQPGEERVSPEQIGSMYENADSDSVLSVLREIEKSVEG